MIWSRGLCCLRQSNEVAHSVVLLKSTGPLDGVGWRSCAWVVDPVEGEARQTPKMIANELLLYWAEHFLQEPNVLEALQAKYPRSQAASHGVTFFPAAGSLLSQVFLAPSGADPVSLRFDFLQPVYLDWALLQERLGAPELLYAASPVAAPVYRVPLKQARYGYCLLETTPEESLAKLQSFTLVRFPAGSVGGAFFAQEALVSLLSAFQQGGLSLEEALHWFGQPQQEDAHGAQLLPYLGANVSNAFVNKEKEDPERVARVDLRFVRPLEVNKGFFAQQGLTLTGPLESLLLVPIPTFVYQVTGQGAELLLTVEGLWSQESQRVKSLILRRSSRWQRPSTQSDKPLYSAPTFRRNAVATQPAIELPAPQPRADAKLAPRKAGSEEVAKAELEETSEASRRTMPVVALPPRLVVVYQGRSYPIEQEEFIIGRGKQSQLEIPDPDLSRKHASIKKQGDRYFIEDHSINGIRCLGVKIKRQEVKEGDVFLLCEHELRIISGRPPEKK